jgi:hypothetical protein
MTDLSSFLDIAVGSIMLVIIISVHGFALDKISGFFSRNYGHLERQFSDGKSRTTFVVTIWLLLSTHLFEAFLWSLPMYYFGMFPTSRIAFYFAAQTYTTLGMGDIVLPPEWRLVGPIVAISGLFAFGWTGSVLVYMVGELGKLRAERDKKKAGMARGRKAPQ